MSRSVNRVVLIGNIGKDAEAKQTGSGISVAEFTLATSYRKKEGEDYKDFTDWHRIILWRNEAVVPYLLKGKPVYVSGRLATRSYDNKDGVKVYVVEVVADEVILLGGGGKADGAQPHGKDAPAGGVEDDDIPF